MFLLYATTGRVAISADVKIRVRGKRCQLYEISLQPARARDNSAAEVATCVKKKKERNTAQVWVSFLKTALKSSTHQTFALRRTTLHIV